MKKYFSISRKQTTIVITIITLAVLGAWYYLVYIPGNEKHLYEQHFRWVQNIDKNIRNKIDASDSLVGNLLKAYVDYKKPDSIAEKYIRKYYTRNIPISITTDTSQSKINAASDDVQFSLGTDSSMNGLIISAQKIKTDNNEFKKKSLRTVSLIYDFDEFFKPLLPQQIFDHYVIFYDGKYIYEDFHSGLGYNPAYEDSLIKIGKFITGATIVDQEIGGVKYKMFLQPLNFINNKRLIIAALHSDEKIETEKKELPAHIAVWAITMALGVLLLLPWIKLYLLGKHDKIGFSDATQCVLVAKLLMSLLVLFFLKNILLHDADISTEPVKVLADTIRSSFTKEVDAAYLLTGKCDAILKKNKAFYDVINVGKDSLKNDTAKEDVFDKTTYKLNDPLKKSLDTIFKQGMNLKQFIEINWMDSLGNVKYNWTKYSSNNVHGNYKDRDYFKNISRNITITPNENDSISFTLSQVISRSDGSFRTIICKKSIPDSAGDKKDTTEKKDTATIKRTNIKFVALSFRMKTLDSTIMPFGYSFAILDNNGDVKYHSNSDRNLNENLLEEFTAKKPLQNALRGRFTETFKTKYYEGDYTVRVEPIKGYPYFIVIMSDENLPESVNIETFSFSWGMILLFLFIVIVDLSILISASSRTSILRKEFLVLSWLWPRKSSGYEYLVASMGNIAMIIFLVVGFNLFRPLPYFFVLVFCIPLLTIFLNSIFLHRYNAEKNETNIRYKVRCACWSAIYLLLLNIIALMALGWSSYWPILLLESGMVVTGSLFIYYYDNAYRNPEENSAESNNHYLRNYTLMIVTRLLVTSAIPVIFFYTASYNFEQNLLTRYVQYDYISQLENKFHGLEKIDKCRVTDYRNAVYTDNARINKIDINTANNCVALNSKLSKEDSNTAKMFELFGSYLETVSGISNDNFYQSASADGYYLYNNIFRNGACTACDSCKGLYLLHKASGTKEGSPKYVELSSSKLNYFFPPIFSWASIQFWLLFLLAILLFSWLLYQVIKKLFSLNIQPVLSWKEVGAISNKLSPQKSVLWVVGLTTNDMLEKAKTDLSESNKITWPQEKDFVLDFDNLPAGGDRKIKDIQIQQVNNDNYLLHLTTKPDKPAEWDKMKSDVLKSTCRYAFLLNIESSINDSEASGKKLEVIKELLGANKKIIIISAIHPFYIKEILENELKPTATSRLVDTLFNNSPVIVLPLIENQTRENRLAINTSPGKSENDNASIIAKVINAEMKYTGFLKELSEDFAKQSIAVESDAKKIQTDMLILRIQSFAHNFYYSLWQSFSPDEKFILYDLAEDGFVNIKNSFAVNLLINKGIVTTEEGYLHIFNRSFRNFIVTSISEEEATKMHRLHIKDSNWSKLQGPLVLVVAAVLVFLSISQEGVYTKVVALLSSIGAAIPILLKILSVLGGQSGKNEKSIQAA